MLPAPVADQLKQVTSVINLFADLSMLLMLCFNSTECSLIFFLQQVFLWNIFDKKWILFSGKAGGRGELRLRDDLLLGHRRLHGDVGRFDAASSGRLSQRPLHLLRFYDWKFWRLQGKIFLFALLKKKKKENVSNKLTERLKRG